ncbi:HD domain-containing protein [Clostridium sp. D2Q-14]|uniref:HD domain-containing protein n=1 Tax=Anaeromonas gelatinilytica TaxID=2683194 RepID=UPI00193BC4B1|nr:HD domain-containing protein [Anaeromonas gelatinilytica]MBS4536505.1 HD domain-containing protein [Anaeromonas gelatinilytica]
MLKKYNELKSIVERELSCSAHNIDHVKRVFNTCITIAKTEKNVDLDVLLPAALLHDIARVKEIQDKTGEIDHAELGSDMAEKILDELGYKEDSIERIKHCILTHRFRSNNPPKTIEAKILFDADKLDAIGAVGLSRSYMLAGQHGQRIYINKPIKEYMENNTVENGRLKDISKHSPMIEYEFKFKNIPKKLNTKKAKKLAKARIEFMDSFFKRLKFEIEGIE